MELVRIQKELSGKLLTLGLEESESSPALLNGIEKHSLSNLLPGVEQSKVNMSASLSLPCKG